MLVSQFESLRARQTVLHRSQSISHLLLILTWYGRKQGNGGTRNAGVIQATTRAVPATGRLFFAVPRFNPKAKTRTVSHAPADRLQRSKLTKSAHG